MKVHLIDVQETRYELHIPPTKVLPRVVSYMGETYIFDMDHCVRRNEMVPTYRVVPRPYEIPSNTQARLVTQTEWESL